MCVLVMGSEGGWVALYGGTGEGLGCLLEGSSNLSTAPHAAQEGRSQVMLVALGDITSMG